MSTEDQKFAAQRRFGEPTMSEFVRVLRLNIQHEGAIPVGTGDDFEHMFERALADTLAAFADELVSERC